MGLGDSYQIGDIFNWHTAEVFDVEKHVHVVGTPEAISTAERLVQNATLVANRGDQAPNKGVIYLGTETLQTFPLQPGQSIVLTAPEGKRLDLSKFFIRVDVVGDGVRGQDNVEIIMEQPGLGHLLQGIRDSIGELNEKLVAQQRITNAHFERMRSDKITEDDIDV